MAEAESLVLIIDLSPHLKHRAENNAAQMDKNEQKLQDPKGRRGGAQTACDKPGWTVATDIHKAASYQSPDTHCSGTKGTDGTAMSVGAMQRTNVPPLLQYHSCISAKGYT